jgi:hypothetical protein
VARRHPPARVTASLALIAAIACGGERTAEQDTPEYLRGLTMAGPGDPAQYLTILRYRVTKRGG